MKWKRAQPGVYTAGPYTVERHEIAGGGWIASGPGMSAGINWHTKNLAQDECRIAAKKRAADPDANAPVVGDIVEVLVPVWSGQRAQVTSIMAGAEGGAPLWCVTRRGKKLCLFRREIKVVVP